MLIPSDRCIFNWIKAAEICIKENRGLLKMEIKTDIIGEVFVPVLYSPSPHQSSEWKKKKDDFLLPRTI